MPEISGLTLAKVIDKKIKIIFTTAYREYALDGFDLQAVDYLLKPIDYPELVKAIDKFKTQFQQTQPTIPDWSILQETLKVIRSGKDYKTRFAVKKGHHLASIPVANDSAICAQCCRFD